ncbi:hypothetical protein NPIL_645781 [Nephila pilipes]|uniref:BTB domain-containing protein n=1 Tax=Nephila pilipes TaxID=299642 RepID=A0A8X6NDX0_NEPPI|nr:hypothetical protein NPIL_645781 [Nephila pilipes]
MVENLPVEKFETHCKPTERADLFCKMEELFSSLSIKERNPSGVSECTINYLSDHTFQISFPVTEFQSFPKLLTSNACHPLCSTWKTVVHMNYPNSKGTLPLRVKLVRLDHRPHVVKACTVVSMLDNEELSICEMKNDTAYFTDKCIASSTMCTHVPFKDWWKPNCKSQVHIVVSTYGCCVETTDENHNDQFNKMFLKPPTAEMNAIQLQSDLQSAYDSGSHEDVEISHAGKTIGANKFMMVTRLPFGFDFDSERVNGHEFNPNYGARIISAFLRYLHTGWLEEDLSTNMVIKLLDISQYYTCEPLYSLCENLLISNINADNWSTIVSLCHLNDNSRIYDAVNAFLRKNKRQIASRTDWKEKIIPLERLFKDLCMRHPFLLNIMLQDREDNEANEEE